MGLKWLERLSLHVATVVYQVLIAGQPRPEPRFLPTVSGRVGGAVRSPDCRAGASAAGCSHCRTDCTSACASGWLSPPSPGQVWGCTSYYSRSSRHAQTAHKHTKSARATIWFSTFDVLSIQCCSLCEAELLCTICDNQSAGTEVCWARLIKCHSSVNPLPAERWYFR